MQREFLIAEFGLRIRLCRPTGCYRCDLLRFQIRIPQSAIRNPLSAWSGRTELNCRHEFPGLGCSRYTTPRKSVQSLKSNVQSLLLSILTLDFGRWTLDYPLTQTTCLISATIFTRSLWLRITALMSL